MDTIYLFSRSQSKCTVVHLTRIRNTFLVHLISSLTVSEFVGGRDSVCNIQVCSILTLLAATGVVLVLKVVFNREKILILRGKQSVLTLDRRLIRYFVKIFF